MGKYRFPRIQEVRRPYNIYVLILICRNNFLVPIFSMLQERLSVPKSHSHSICYQSIINTIRSKRQKSDCVDSVQIRKGNNLTYLTFAYTEIAKMWAMWDDQQSLQMPFIATVVRFPNQKENQGQPYLLLETQQKVCSSYQACRYLEI